MKPGTSFRRAVVLLAALAVVAAACGSSSKATSPSTTAGSSSSQPASTGTTAQGESTGITATTITVGQLADVSGPVPGLFAGAQEGLGAWAADVNSTGGIGGRKVVVEFKDAGLNCNSYTNGIKSLASSAAALVGTFSLVDVCGETTLKANPDLLDLQAVVLNPAIFNYPTVYTPLPNPPGASTTVYQWVKDKYGAAAIQKTAALWGATESFSYNEMSNAMKSIGYDIVYNRGFAVTETNFTSDILRMKAEGVKVVELSNGAVTNITEFLQQAAQQNFHPLAVINGTAYDTSFFKILGNPADADPLVIYLSNAMYLGQDSQTVPEISTVQSWVSKEYPGKTVNSFTVSAWAAGLLFQDVLAKAGSDPTRSSLLAAVKTINSFNANGLLPNENPGGKQPTFCQVIASAKNGTYQRVDPPTTGFECNGKFVPYAASS